MKNLLLLVACLTAPVHSLADWVVDPVGSYVGFASVKNDLIAENHSFTAMIPIRNERIRSMLFEVAEYPDVTVTANLNIDEFTLLGLGESKMETIPLSVNLHGMDLSKNVLVKVTRSSNNNYEVTSLGPIVIHASQFALSDGLESLRKIAGLQSIDLTVPVTFALRLVKIQPIS